MRLDLNVLDNLDLNYFLQSVLMAILINYEMNSNNQNDLH